jgi:hypothetical protein
MDVDTVLVFTANGMGNAEPELRFKLAKIFLGLLASGGMTDLIEAVSAARKVITL